MSSLHYCAFLKRALLVVMTCAVALGFYTSAARADEYGTDSIYDLILEVKHGRKTLSQDLIGIEKDGRYFVPMLQLARVVQFKAEGNVDSAVLHGFYIHEDNSYQLDARNGTYTVKGEVNNFSREDVIVLNQGLGLGDIYVTPELLNAIWPLNVKLDPLLSQLKISEDFILPAQLAQERSKKRKKRLDQKQGESELLDLPRVDSGYKRFTLPALDLSAANRWDSEEGSFSNRLNVQGRNDLLGAEANYNLRFSYDSGAEDSKLDIEDSRFLLSRRSYEDGDLPYGLKLMQAGDIRARAPPLVDGSLVGRGVLVSTEPQKRERSFDEITIEGYAQPGWEVELYRNAELIGFQTVTDTGEYRFENVTLNTGKNRMRTVLYGPQGEVEEHEEEYSISSDMVAPGKTIMEATLVDSDRDLLFEEDSQANRPSGYASNLHVIRGISRNLSAFGNVTSTPTEDGRHNYASLGLNFSLLGTLGSIEGYKDMNGGTAADLRLARKVYGTDLNLRTAVMKDFESEQNRFGDSARTFETDVTASRNFQLPFGSLGLSTGIDYEEHANGNTRLKYRTGQNLSAGKARFTNNLTRTINNGDHVRTDGQFNTTYNISPRWLLRSFLNYDVYPEMDLRDIRAQLRYKDRDKFTATLEAQQGLQENGKSALGAQFGYDFGKFRTGLDMDWRQDQGYDVLLRTNMSMAPYGPDQRYI